MITMLTGLPGNGKTLRVLQIVEELCRKDNRPLFVMGINLLPEFPLEWKTVPPVAQWTEKRPLEEDPSIMAPAFTFPVNSVIVIDEAQKVFRPRSTSSAVPDHVAAFETHRHEGIDFFLLTQHPMFVDPNIRRLTNRHIHMVRVFGAQAANIHEWQQVKENCDKMRNNSQQKPWLFPKHIYKWYESSKSHTYKFRPPLRAVLLILLPFIVAFLIWTVVSWFKGKDATTKQGAPASTSAAASSPAPGRSAPADWFTAHTPRVPGLPHTAPWYDGVTAPVDAPAPVGCALVVDRCRCYSAQGTVLNVSEEMCRGLVDTGFFKEWNGEKGKENSR